MTQDKKLLPNVAARRLGVTDRRVRQMVQEGKLPGERQGERGLRIPASAVEAYRQEHE
jgi:excisionase family DNA binding protein